MAFDLTRLREQLQGALLVSPYPLDVAVAVVADTFRMAGAEPPEPPPFATWRSWTRGAGRKLAAEQLGMLAHLLVSSSLREETVKALAASHGQASVVLPGFLGKVPLLTAEMIRSNRFRQEEFLRRWVEAVGGAWKGETAARSAERLEELDFNRTEAEYRAADKARKKEAAERKKALEEAARREADARGWRE